METVTLRLLPYAVADGPRNMAADEVMLHTAAHDKLGSLRFYGWSEPTVSLGYFQSAQVRSQDARLASLPFVRRPSGGGTLVHHHELTYCLALPPGSPYQEGESWMQRMHGIMTKALGELGLTRQIASVTVDAKPAASFLCFQQQTVGDLLARGSKVVGSAQRKYRQALMQHGSILLQASPFAPHLPGIAELTGRLISVEALQEAVEVAFTTATRWKFKLQSWNPNEMKLTEEVSFKYASTAWNERR